MIECIATTVAVLLAGPAFMFAIECLLGLRPLREQTPRDGPSFAVLVPAHNEESGITETVKRLAGQLRHGDRLLVVADNCSDETARRAREAGADVVERSDPQHHGKGFALAFGRSELSADPPPIVIVMDADCWADPGALVRLAAVTGRKGGAVQGANLLVSEPSAHPLVKLSVFAFRIKNLVRQRALARLGTPAILQGTGMAFSWGAFMDARLATEAIAEDLEIGLTLLATGHRIGWTEQAKVWSRSASAASMEAQRTRWEHGFIYSALASAPRLARMGLFSGHPKLLLLALDLMVPPLALLTAILSAGFLISLAAVALLGAWLPSLTLFAAIAAVIIASSLAWVFEGRRILPFAALLKAPAYVLWKIPIYVQLIFKRQRRWVRAARDE
jgi:cellulose synthase/poly-beta-1,6-N-acetylglucosamine synthase-like glycosyltransferase